MTVPWNGLGPEPLTDVEWCAWLRAADEDELQAIANDYPGRSDGIDARAELDRREYEGCRWLSRRNRPATRGADPIGRADEVP